MKKGLHAFISGKVQGVSYRSAAKKTAISLGLLGWARNLPDGRVEVTAYGEENLLAEYEKWFWIGSERAEVTNVQSHPISWEFFETFSILETPGELDKP